MAYSLVPGRRLPTTRKLKLNIFLMFTFYFLLAGIGTWVIVHGGRSWAGDTQTLTSTLAALGMVFTLAGMAVSSLSQSARMQYLVDKAIKGSVSLQRIHEMDMILRGVMPSSTGFGASSIALSSPLSVSLSQQFSKRRSVSVSSHLCLTPL